MVQICWDEGNRFYQTSDMYEVVCYRKYTDNLLLTGTLLWVCHHDLVHAIWNRGSLHKLFVLFVRLGDRTNAEFGIASLVSVVRGLLNREFLNNPDLALSICFITFASVKTWFFEPPWFSPAHRCEAKGDSPAMVDVVSFNAAISACEKGQQQLGPQNPSGLMVGPIQTYHGSAAATGHEIREPLQ